MDRLVTLSRVIDTLGPIKGEKSLQKMIYLVENYGQRLGYQYSWQHYGPTSFQLEREIQEIEALGLISITFDNGIPIYSGQSTRQYQSQFWMEKYRNCEFSGRLTKTLEFLQKLGKKHDDPTFLELVASLDYMEKSNQSSPYETNSVSRSSSDLLDTAQQTLQKLRSY